MAAGMAVTTNGSDMGPAPLSSPQPLDSVQDSPRLLIRHALRNATDTRQTTEADEMHVSSKSCLFAALDKLIGVLYVELRATNMLNCISHLPLHDTAQAQTFLSAALSDEWEACNLVDTIAAVSLSIYRVDSWSSREKVEVCPSPMRRFPASTDGLSPGKFGIALPFFSPILADISDRNAALYHFHRLASHRGPIPRYPPLRGIILY
ncbi:Hypothetical predicted protein [Scomber scombrus]|uniref:Uncharacterized protein n=1 Tax=Scomber scombrus TaxID=13677 RepID=A0AAV1NTR8_SCOSC